MVTRNSLDNSQKKSQIREKRRILIFFHEMFYNEQFHYIFQFNVVESTGNVHFLIKKTRLENENYDGKSSKEQKGRKQLDNRLNIHNTPTRNQALNESHTHSARLSCDSVRVMTSANSANYRPSLLIPTARHERPIFHFSSE